MAGKRSPKDLTWAQVAVRNAGFRFGSLALTYAACWAITTESLGREPTMDEFAEWWHESRSSVYRDQAVFRKAFPTLRTPAPIFENERAQRYVRELVRRFKDFDALQDAKSHELDQVALDIGLLPAM
jgi:hypothetical protein